MDNTTDINTSAAAFEALKPRLNKSHTEIMQLLSNNMSGFTADEIATHLCESPLFVRPRITELHNAEKIEKTGNRRKNRSGATANVWRIAA